MEITICRVSCKEISNTKSFAFEYRDSSSSPYREYYMKLKTLGEIDLLLKELDEDLIFHRNKDGSIGVEIFDARID